VSGRIVVLWLAIGGLVLLGVFWAIFDRGLRLAASERQHSQSLALVISSGTGTMRLVPPGKFMAGEEALPLNLPAFYISGQAVRTGLSFREAKAHCEQSGQRLPTSIEWEKAMEQVPQTQEWVDEPHRAKQFELRAFRGQLDPPASPDEEWSTLRGGPGAKRTDYTSAPSRYASPQIGFRCALTPR
jgi:hypothetical protein